MKRNFLSKLFQASLMCCLAVILTGCDEVFGSEDNPIPAYLSMDTSNVTLKVGESKTRTAIAVRTAIVEYSSDHPEFATVDANGTVTGVAVGTATITATATGYSSASGKKMFNTESKSYKVTVVGGSAPAPDLAMLQTPLTLEAAEAGAKVTFFIKVATGVEYSTDGENWSSYTSDTPITLAAIGDKVSFRGTNATYSDGIVFSKISCDKDCYIYGNIMSLIKKEDFENVTTFTADNTFCGLFMNNAKIKNHTDATKYLVLPATTLADNCYLCMFYGCASLTTAPKLPATTLVNGCYDFMFQGCTSLTEAWVKAGYVSSSCMNMFTGAAATGTIHSKTSSNWDTQKGAAGIGGWTVNNDYND